MLVAPTLRAIFAAGHVARIEVDARRADVHVPIPLRGFNARLVLELDPRRIANVSDDALELELTLDAVVHPCRIGCAAIHTVTDLETRQQISWPELAPPAELPVALRALPELACTFCQKGRARVKRLIAGPAVYICDECIVLMITILIEDDALEARVGDALAEAVAYAKPPFSPERSDALLRAAALLCLDDSARLGRIAELQREWSRERAR